MLTERQLLVLMKIIEYYTLTGEPVSSKILVDSGEVKASSATVRNDMSVLEDQGYIEKLHTSSGRVPSNMGYRFYADHLLRPGQLTAQGKAKIEQALGHGTSDYRNIFDQSANILSELTNYTAIVLGPKIGDARITDINLMVFNPRQMMIILEIGGYVIESHMIRLSKNVQSADLQTIVNVFKEELVGCTLTEANQKLSDELAHIFMKTLGIVDLWNPLAALQDILQKWQMDRLYISGQMNLLDFTEGMDIQSIKQLLNTVQSTEELSWIFDQSTSDYQVIMGIDSENQLLHNFAVVSSTYRIHPYGEGVIAVLGPNNMSYSQTLGLVNALRDELIQHLMNNDEMNH